MPNQFLAKPNISTPDANLRGITDHLKKKVAQPAYFVVFQVVLTAMFTRLNNARHFT
jgi:hypothetical protein